MTSGGDKDTGEFSSAVLAQFAVAIPELALEADITWLARACLLDTIGVMLAGVSYSRATGYDLIDRYLASAPSGGRKATVAGRMTGVGVDDAAFANGCLVELLDWQDTTMISRVHCASSVIPAALALSEQADVTGSTLLAAIVAGYEVAARIGQAVHPSHWRRGYQSTGTLNTFGAAAAAATIWGFDADLMRSALGIAGHIVPMSNGDGVFCGYSAKVIHGGEAALIGIRAARLARAGFDAGPIEGLPPRFAAFIPMTSDEPRPEEMVADLGSRWFLRDVWHKPYPTGLLNLAPAEAAMVLSEKADLHLEEIERVIVKTYRDGVTFVGRHYTSVDSSLADCQLSLPYAVAVGLVDRCLGVSQMFPQRIADPSIHELASRVEVLEDAALEDLYPDQLPTTVTVHTRDGRYFSHSIVDTLGSPHRRLSETDLLDKFHANADAVLGQATAHAVADCVLATDDAWRSRSLARLLRAEKRRAPD